MTPEGRLVALLINYACHPTTIGGLYFGGDYAGFATAALEADHPGVPCLFVQGCGGDNKTDNPNPKDPLKFYTRTDDGSTQEPEKFGRRLADAVREALAGPGVPVAGPIRSKLASLELPRLICWIEEKDAAAIAEADGGEPAWSVQHPLPAARWARLARVMAASVNADGSYKKTQPAELIVLRIGDRFIHVGLPGEMTTPIGLRIKGILRGHETLVTAYTLAGIGYFPAAGQIAEGGYEVFQNFDHLPYSPEAEDVLIAKVIETIDSLAAT